MVPQPYSPVAVSAFLSQPTSLSTVLDGMLDRSGARKKVDAVRTVEAWAEVAGPSICAVTQRVRVQGDVLVVSLTSSAWRHTLQLQRDAWRTRLNEHLGGALVREIRFT